ncbi:unnamed protein product [Sphagnum jensenii]|uniref:Secreted protein n=1 Tax=Sphagnum jensenii TaxID=128206 RepID=A0ABP0X5C1_9BRYO
MDTLFFFFFFFFNTDDDDLVARLFSSEYSSPPPAAQKTLYWKGMHKAAKIHGSRLKCICNPPPRRCGERRW